MLHDLAAEHGWRTRKDDEMRSPDACRVSPRVGHEGEGGRQGVDLRGKWRAASDLWHADDRRAQLDYARV